MRPLGIRMPRPMRGGWVAIVFEPVNAGGTRTSHAGPGPLSTRKPHLRFFYGCQMGSLPPEGDPVGSLSS